MITIQAGNGPPDRLQSAPTVLFWNLAASLGGICFRMRLAQTVDIGDVIMKAESARFNIERVAAGTVMFPILSFPFRGQKPPSL